MKRSTDRILTTHAGSLSRPANLIAMSKAIAIGESKGDAAYAQVLAASVADVVKKQRELGVDIPDDGEFGKPVGGSYDYGAWWNYAFARMSGFSPAGSPAAAAHETQHKKSTVADVALATALRSWLQVPASFQPLSTPAVASSTIIGMIAATVVFAWTAQTRSDPIRAFLVIATVGLFLSWLPDLAIWVTAVFHSTTGAGILSLMTLHVVAAACAVAILTRFGLR